MTRDELTFSAAPTTTEPEDHSTGTPVRDVEPGVSSGLGEQYEYAEGDRSATTGTQQVAEPYRGADGYRADDDPAIVGAPGYGGAVVDPLDDSDIRTETAYEEPAAAQTDTSDTRLVDDSEGLLSRWQDVQVGFVDDPKTALSQADDLVRDVLDQVSKRFEALREHVDSAEGAEPSTEDRRLALQRYRAFFQRLLAA